MSRQNKSNRGFWLAAQGLPALSPQKKNMFKAVYLLRSFSVTWSEVFTSTEIAEHVLRSIETKATTNFGNSLKVIFLVSLPYDKSWIEKVFSVIMVGYWPWTNAENRPLWPYPQSMKYMNCCFVFFKQGRRDTYHFNFLATSDVQPLVLLAGYRKFFLSCLYYQIWNLSIRIRGLV